MLKKGVVVDASITESPSKPRGKKEYEVVQDRQEPTDQTSGQQESQSLVLKVQSNVDIQASWIKKAGKLRYGYKKHFATDTQGLVLAVITTPANESDMVHLENVVKRADLKKGSRVRADKGYCSESNRKYLKPEGLKDSIMHKAVKNKALNHHQIKFNKILSQVRFKVERTFCRNYPMV